MPAANAALVERLRARAVFLTITRQRRPRRRKVLPKMRQPDAIRVEYFSQLRGLMGEFKSIVDREIISALPRLLPRRDGVQTSGLLARADSVEAIEAIFRRLRELFAILTDTDAIRRFLRTVASRISVFNQHQLGAVLQSGMGIELSLLIQSEPWLAEAISNFLAENVSLIRTVSETYLNQVEDRVFAAVRTGMRHEELAKELEERFNVSESRAKVIARDQVGKFNSKLNTTRQQNLGITHFIWRTANDNRVRPEHEDLDGKRFAFDDPPAEGLPGEPIMCRCYPEPDLSGVLDALTE